MKNLGKWLPTITLALILGTFLLWTTAPDYSYSFENDQLVSVRISKPLSNECRFLSYYRHQRPNNSRREHASCYQTFDEDVEVSAELDGARAFPELIITSVVIYDNGVSTTFDTPEVLKANPMVVRKAEQVLALGRNKFLKAQNGAASILTEAR